MSILFCESPLLFPSAKVTILLLLLGLSTASNSRKAFHPRTNETALVAVCVNNPDCSSLRIKGMITTYVRASAKPSRQGFITSQLLCVQGTVPEGIR
jgi:hypothetical protein